MAGVHGEMISYIDDAVHQVVQTVGDHAPIIGTAVSVLSFLFGPYDVGLHAVTLMFIVSVLAIVLDYLKAWVDPEIDDRIEIDRMAGIFMWRWISFCLLLMIGHMSTQLFGHGLVDTVFHTFICVTETFIILPFIENISGISFINLKAMLLAHPALKDVAKKLEEKKKED